MESSFSQFFFSKTSLSQVKSLSRVRLSATPWTVASSVQGILQARILEWVAISFSRGSSRPRIKPRSPALEANALTSEPPGKPQLSLKNRSCPFSVMIDHMFRNNKVGVLSVNSLKKLSWCDQTFPLGSFPLEGEGLRKPELPWSWVLTPGPARWPCRSVFLFNQVAVSEKFLKYSVYVLLGLLMKSTFSHFSP